MANKTDLAAEKKDLMERLGKINNELSKGYAEKYLPALQKKYVGGYFKKINKYSYDDKGWPLYTKVESIEEDDVYEVGDGPTATFKGYEFQTTSDNRRFIDVVSSYVHCVGKRIPEKEFFAALVKFKEAIASFA